MADEELDEPPIFRRRVSRRNFLKLCLGLLVETEVGSWLASCAPTPTQTPKPTVETFVPIIETKTLTVVRPTPTITITRLFTPESTPTPSPSPFPTKTPEAVPTIRVETDTEKAIKKLMKPLWEEALKTRENKAKNDKEWSNRVDTELNHNRVNFLLFGYGKSVEPPNPNLIEVGSHTIISVNVDTGQIDIVSFTHDIWDPEINKYLNNFGQPGSAQKIDRGFFIAKQRDGNEKALQFMDKQVEQMTGLSVDHSVAFQDDEVFSDLIDGVFGGLEVDVPSDFKVQGYFYKGAEHKDIGEFKKGSQLMSGERVAQFIKTVPYAQGAYGVELEHNVRKAIVFEALFKKILKQKGDLSFQAKALWFLGPSFFNSKIINDFQPASIVNVAKSFFSDSSLGNLAGTTNLPNEKIFRTETYMVDPASGDGGMRWVNSEAGDDLRIGKIGNPVIKELINKNVFPSRMENGVKQIDMEVPVNSNPYGDLVKDYWGSTRSLVKKRFTTEQ